MGKLGSLTIEDWGSGLINSMEPDAVPPNAYVRGFNAALTSIGGERAVVMKRKGCRCLNATPVTGVTAIVGQHQFRLLSGSSFAPYHLLVSENGRLDYLDSSNVVTTIDATAFTSSSSQDYLPDFADANNLCFIANGVDKKKFNGTTLQNFGITKTALTPTLAQGAAGSHSGTYEAFVTFYNSNTGQESSAGATSGQVTVSSKKIDWSAIPVSSDTQVTSRRLYIRNTSTQSLFYLVHEIADNTSTTYTSDVADANLTEAGPDSSENNPPPSGIKYLAWHRSRMFAADDTNVYFSKIELPESFDPDDYEPINIDDGQKIVGIISAFDILVVFKSHSIWAIVGDDPATWLVSSIDAGIGGTSHRSIKFANNRVFFWSEQGPASLDQSTVVTLLAPPFISRTVSADNLNFGTTAASKICAEHEEANQRILFAVPEVGQTRNTAILPFNYRINRWESDKWDPMDVASFGKVYDTDGRPNVILGGYSGQVFRWWDTSNDGATGTVSGSFVASGTSVSTVTDLTATFDTTGGGLVERKVTIVDSSGFQVGSIRPRITANSGTALTLSTGVVGLTNGATYTYYVAGPAFDWMSVLSQFEQPFIKKRMRFIYLSMRPTTSSVMVRVDAYANYNLTSYTGKLLAFTAADQSGTWDVSTWDNAVFDITGIATKRMRVAKSGQSMQVRLRQYAPNQDITLFKLGMTMEMLSEKLS